MTQELNNSIYYFNQLGYNILEIKNLSGEIEYFLITSFEEATQNSFKHVLSGKDITPLLVSYHSINLNDPTKQQEIITKVSELKTRKYHLHKDIQFILYLA